MEWQGMTLWTMTLNLLVCILKLLEGLEVCHWRKSAEGQGQMPDELSQESGTVSSQMQMSALQLTDIEKHCPAELF